MPEEPLVSVIMPAYNAEKYIVQAIKSIIDQTYKNWELLICDDASTDNTLKIITDIAKSDNRIRFFSNAKNLKLLKTRNLMLEKVHGKIIAFQDADDYSDIKRLEYSVNEFKKNKNLGLLSCQVSYVDRNGNLIRTSKKPTTYNSVIESIYSKNVVGGSIMMIRANALKSVGGKFRSYFDGLSNQDYDLSLLIAQKFETYSLPQALYFYRQHEESNSKMIEIDRVLAKEVVIYLAKQRKERGSDDLMDGHPEMVDQFFDQLREPYIKDPAKIHREFAANFMYAKLYGKAIKTSWKSILERPGAMKNWRTFFYCVRVSVIKTLQFRDN